MKLRTTKGQTAKKRIRVSRAIKDGSLRIFTKAFVATGKINDATERTICLSPVTRKQQMRERNSAYHFFSLD